MAQPTRPARGMRDFLPEDVRRREYVIGVVEEVYRRYGFEPLETPALENIETLTGKYGEEGNQLIFKVLRRGEHAGSGETDLALRYDLTVPLARVVAEHRGKLPKFFKRYQIQPVWRADRPARGRFREFYQCDVDAIGSKSPLVEVEMLAAVSEVLQKLGFRDFVIQLNHRELLTAILNAAGVEAPMHATALIAIDKLDKLGRAGVLEEMQTRGLAPAAAEKALAALDAESSQAMNLGDDARGSAALRNVNDIMRLAEATAAAGHVRLTPRLARGLSYYTGAIMEVAVPDLAGSLGGGGRYDGLIGMFSGEQIPACGFSLGLERILVVMAERNMFPEGLATSAADVMVTLFEGQPVEHALQLAGELRAAGLRVDIYPEPDKLGKQFKYAGSRGVKFVTVVGADERASGEVTLKNMETGEQTRVKRAEIASRIAPAAFRPSPESRTPSPEPRP